MTVYLYIDGSQWFRVAPADGVLRGQADQGRVPQPHGRGQWGGGRWVRTRLVTNEGWVYLWRINCVYILIPGIPVYTNIY